MQTPAESIPPALLIAGGILAIPFIPGGLALLTGMVTRSADQSRCSLQDEGTPTGNPLEDQSDNIGRLIFGLFLYAAGYAGLAAVALKGPHDFLTSIAYPFLVALLLGALYLMFLRFHIVLSRSPLKSHNGGASCPYPGKCARSAVISCNESKSPAKLIPAVPIQVIARLLTTTP